MQIRQPRRKTPPATLRCLVCLVALPIFLAASGGLFAQGTLALTGATIETASKAGTLENATILIKNGEIAGVGSDVEIPVSAQIVDASGKTIIPGIVDPYYVVSIGRNTTQAAPRTIVFNGRVFTIGGGRPSIATTFAKVSDGLDLKGVNWQPAIRSGITTFHVVTGGYAQSMVASPVQDSASWPAVGKVESDGCILVTVSNDTKSLDVLRKNLKPPASRSPGTPSTTASAIATQWATVRDGKSPVFVNVNNASAILHAEAILVEYPKAKTALVANGPNVFSALESLDAKRYTVVLPPSIDRVPNSTNRVNVAKLLADKKINFVLSLSLGQSDFRAQQSTPLFGPAMLIRAGLDRQTTIRALTIQPAKLIGLDKKVGSLEVGKQANFVVFGEDPFSATASIEQVYVSGEPVNE